MIESSTFQAQEPNNLPRPEQKVINHNSQSKLVYRAKQVLERTDSNDKEIHLPRDTNVIGKLLTAIDSRDLSTPIKVLLPYGAKFKSEEFLEKDTVLVGKANYQGKGDRIFITFDRALLPSGEEKFILANALDSSDYANGVISDLHSEADVRIAGTLGLTMISSMTDVLTEKTALGEAGVVTPKANMKNAALQGLSKVSELEASRNIESMSQTPPYITLDAGVELIVSIGSFKDQNNEEQ